MKRLFLIRHAKSSWKLPIEDKERPLSNKGIFDANLLADKVSNYLPDSFVIWSSTAKRAIETARIFSDYLNYSKDLIILKDSLYTFDVDELISQIRTCDNKYNDLVVFCHNPAITDFVNQFGGIYIENVVTTGFVFMEFNQDSWDSIYSGVVQKIIFPKDFK